MDILRTVLNRGCSMWDRERLPEDEFRARLGRIREGMRERSLDLLLVYGDSRRFGHLASVSHFIPKNRGALAIIPLEGEPALVVQEPSRNNPFSKTLTWIDEVRSVGQFAQGLADALKARQLKPGRVGLAAVEEQLNIREWNGLAKVLEGAEFSDFSDCLTSLRFVKSPREIAVLRETSRILEEALAVFEKTAKAGRKEYEVMAEVEREARRRGVEDFRALLARSGAPEIGLRPPGDSALAGGEAILVLIAASYQRYWAELGQTFSLGRTAERIVKSHDLASRVFRQLVEGVRAGLSPMAASGWLREVPSPGAVKSLSAYGLGNGLGMDLDEEPYLGKTEDHPIKPGMVLTLRACLTGPDCGSALISRPFLVTGAGLDALVRYETKLVSIEI